MFPVSGRRYFSVQNVLLVAKKLNIYRLEAADTIALLFGELCAVVCQRGMNRLRNSFNYLI